MSAKGIACGVFKYIDDKKNTWFLVNTGIFLTKEEAEIKAGDLIGQGFFYSKPVKITLEG
jgi:hypothetical protein